MCGSSVFVRAIGVVSQLHEEAKNLLAWEANMRVDEEASTHMRK